MRFMWCVGSFCRGIWWKGLCYWSQGKKNISESKSVEELALNVCHRCVLCFLSSRDSLCWGKLVSFQFNFALLYWKFGWMHMLLVLWTFSAPTSLKSLIGLWSSGLKYLFSLHILGCLHHSLTKHVNFHMSLS